MYLVDLVEVYTNIYSMDQKSAKATKRTATNEPEVVVQDVEVTEPATVEVAEPEVIEENVQEAEAPQVPRPTPPTIYMVRPDQVGNEDVTDFLRKSISRQFEGQDFFIANEQQQDRVTHYSVTPRKIKSFLIQNNTNNTQHALFFDITDVSFARNIFGVR
jgi:hypothetical protein